MKSKGGLTKKNRENRIATGETRTLNSQQFLQAEQSFFSAKNGFSNEIAELTQELSAKVNKLNQLKATCVFRPDSITDFGNIRSPNSDLSDH